MSKAINRKVQFISRERIQLVPFNVSVARLRKYAALDMCPLDMSHVYCAMLFLCVKLPPDPCLGLWPPNIAIAK